MCAIIHPVQSPKDIIKRDMWWNLGVAIILLIMIANHTLSRTEGIILLIGMAVYIFILIIKSKNLSLPSDNTKTTAMWKSILFTAGGLAAIIWGGNLVVDNASLIAHSLGVSDTLIVLTIVAIGTSLPELVTSIVATLKKGTDIAMGNAVGSCLFNIMFILCFTSILSPIQASSELIIDTAVLVAVSLLMLIFARTRKETSRFEGIICVAAYLSYSIYIILR